MLLSNFGSLMRRIAALAGILTLFVAPSCGQDNTFDTWNRELKASGSFAKPEALEKNAPLSIFLLGEIHNSVRVQQQLGVLLETLYRKGQIEAILVEGSAGAIDGEGLRRTLARTKATILGVKATARFWKGQLDLGHIAGYEYVALTQANIKVFGVEDIQAKAEYTIESGLREKIGTLQQMADMYKRSLALVEQVSPSLDANALHATGAEAEIEKYRGQIDSFVSLTSGTRERYAQALEVVQRLNALYRKIEPIQKLLADNRGMTRKRETEYANAFANAGYRDEKEIMTDLSRIKEDKAWLDTREQEFQELNVNVRDGEGQLLDQFFIVANAVRSAAGGVPISSLQTFLRDERERNRLNRLNDNPEIPYLADRDRHMVDNTMKYFGRNPNIKKVVLIVGDAHLKDLKKLFGLQNVNLLTAGVEAGNGSIEQWESKAWIERSQRAERIFSSVDNKTRGRLNKEKSRLQDPVFRQEVPLLLENVIAAEKGGLNFGRDRIFEVDPGVKDTKAIVVTPKDTNLRANWGSYVVGSGKLPNDTSKNYLIVDRKLLRGSANKATTEGVWFAPVYRTRNIQGKAATKVELPIGILDFNDFAERIPGEHQKIPTRIVLATEGDATPIQEAFGGGSEPPSWRNTKTASAEPPDSRRPYLFFTKNIDRARSHMDAMAKQDPLQAAHIASFHIGLPGEENSNLDDMWFTPKRGDHPRAFLIVGDNTAEFRSKLEKAAAAGLLENKQIALGTCFDANETDSLREMLLEAGALMVWTPENRISPQAAQKLQNYMEKVDAAPASTSPSGLDAYIDKALELWQGDAPTDSDLVSVRNASRWTELRIPNQTSSNQL